MSKNFSEESSFVICNNPEKECNVPAMVSCEKCDMTFCKPCGLSLHDHAMLWKHELINIADMVPKCSVHKGIPLDLFSEESKDLLCVACHYHLDEHQRSHVRKVKDVVQESRGILQQTQAIINQREKEVQKRIDDLHSDTKDIKANSASCLVKVSVAIDQLRLLSDQRQVEIEDEINIIQKEKLAQCDEMLQDAEKANSLLLTVRHETDLALTQNNYGILGVFGNITAKFKEANANTYRALGPSRVNTSMKFGHDKFETNIRNFGFVVEEPDIPDNFKVIVDEKACTMKVSWDPVQFTSPITAYTLEMKRNDGAAAEQDEGRGQNDQDFKQEYSDLLTEYSVTTFQPNSNYSYRVRAVSEVGVSEWSEVVSCDSPKLRNPAIMFPLGSKILMPQASTYMAKLVNLFDEEDITLRLIYQGTRDGFTHRQFHAKCDAASQTLVVVKSENGYIGGGYASQSWSGNAIYKQNNGQFLFSLHPTIFKLTCSEHDYAQYCDPCRGPRFGRNPWDLWINMKNIGGNPNSYMNVAPGYANPPSVLNSKTLFGAKLSTAVEVEVFEVLFEVDSF